MPDQKNSVGPELTLSAELMLSVARKLGMPEELIGRWQRDRSHTRLGNTERRRPKQPVILGVPTMNDRPPTGAQTPPLPTWHAVASDVCALKALSMSTVRRIRRFVGFLTLLCAPGFVPLPASAADRHTVFTLIDESGTMKADDGLAQRGCVHARLCFE